MIIRLAKNRPNAGGNRVLGHVLNHDLQPLRASAFQIPASPSSIRTPRTPQRRAN